MPPPALDMKLAPVAIRYHRFSKVLVDSFFCCREFFLLNSASSCILTGDTSDSVPSDKTPSAGKASRNSDKKVDK
jgi:hypothetical protein